MKNLPNPDEPFFVGYLPVPSGLGRFLGLVSVGLVILFAAIGLVSGGTQDDPGPGAFRFDHGRQTVTGTVSLDPYPTLLITEGTDQIAPGRVLMLSGAGKTSSRGRAAPLEGQFATASGVLVSRGDLDMLQLRGGDAGLAPADGEAQEIAIERLGRWRLAGEICDGKCLAGAMRPGRGLAHKACANLCIIGDIPPVFVSTQPVEGSAFLLVGGPDGGPMPAALLHHVGSFVALEGEIERRGDLLVLLVDPASIEVM